MTPLQFSDVIRIYVETDKAITSGTIIKDMEISDNDLGFYLSICVINKDYLGEAIYRFLLDLPIDTRINYISHI